MAEAKPSLNSSYNSSAIIERRQRILREARLIIAEVGYDNFSIRKLASCADVAQKTLYNAFGSKDGIISCAIIQFAEEMTGDAGTDEAHPSLEGSLRRMLFINSRVMRVRSYLVALMSIHNSPTATPEIRKTVRNLAVEPSQRLAIALGDAGLIAPYVDVVSFSERLAGFIMAGQTDWALGYVPDEKFLDWMCEGFLIGFCGLTIGRAKAEGEEWLVALRSRSARWTELLESTRAESARGNKRRTEIA